MKDRFGKDITVGCTVAYPGRQGSSCWIATGQVIEVDEGGGTWPDKRRPRLRLEGGGHDPGDAFGKRWIGFYPSHTIVVG